MIPTQRYRELIDACAAIAGLPTWEYRGGVFVRGVWLEGLILHESRGDPKAVRYEAHQDRIHEGDPDRAGEDDGLWEDDKSYGLMQVMGYNIRRLCGIDPAQRPQPRLNYAFALLPITNIALGLRVLAAELVQTGGAIDRALARYNGGPSGEGLTAAPRLGGSMMRRQPYVDLVEAASKRVYADRREL